MTEKERVSVKSNRVYWISLYPTTEVYLSVIFRKRKESFRKSSIKRIVRFLVMALIVDIALIAVLAVCIFFGWKKGFIHAISKFLTYILSFVFANIFHQFIYRVFFAAISIPRIWVMTICTSKLASLQKNNISYSRTINCSERLN